MDALRLAALAEHNVRAQNERDRPALTVCSGRPQPFAEAMCRLLGNTALPCVAENGVWLYDAVTNDYSRDPSVTGEHLAMVDDVRRWVEAELGPKGVVMQPGKTASISLYHNDTEFLRSLAGPVREEFARRGWALRVSLTWLYINCDLVHVSKGTGARRLIERAGLNRERLAAIGDTESDLAVREQVSFFACPANAADEIKAAADMIAEAPEAAGVVELVARLTEGT